MAVAAKAKRRRYYPVIVRQPDENDNLVTFMPLSELAKTLKVHLSTVTRWASTGHLKRTEKKLQNAYNYSLADAVYIRQTPSRELYERGIILTPKMNRDATLRTVAQYVENTAPYAENQGQAWDDFDLCEVLEAVERGERVEDIAKRLGRSWPAVVNKIHTLREAGDLPEDLDDHDKQLKGEWREGALAFLTPEERDALS